MDLYRGKNYGVFTGPNGYYVVRILGDGISHYEALSGGEGWSDELLEHSNVQTIELDSMGEPPVGIDAET